MYVLKVLGVDYSGHTVLEDAVRQRQFLLDHGAVSDDLEIVQKDELEIPSGR